MFYFLGNEPASVSFAPSTVFLWVVNLSILVFCFVKMFVYGDPIIPQKSKEAQKFWLHRHQADMLLKKVRKILELSSINVNCRGQK